MVITASVAGSSTFPLGIGDSNLKKIAAVSDRIKLDDASILLDEEQRGDFSSQGKFDAILARA